MTSETVQEEAKRPDEMGDQDPPSKAAALYDDHEEVVDELAERDDRTGAIARALQDLAGEADE